MKKRELKSLAIGALVTVVSLSAAWTIGRRHGEVEEAPVEVLLESESAATVWDLPVTRNERVDAWIAFLRGDNAELTKVWLERQGKYGPMIRSELRRRQMPEDLIYLALIESGLSPKAYSKAAASGMWQFIAETGRRYGLEVTQEVDERRDPIRSTSAALDYLQKLHARFGSWYLAAAAYNTGENRIDRILRERANGARGDDALFWTIAPYLPRETRDYVPLMLAAGHIAKQPEKYGFEKLDYQSPLDFVTVWVPGSTELTTVAQASGVEESEVAELNPHLTKGRTPANRAYAVRVPRGSEVAFEARFPALYREARLARPALPAPAKVAASTSNGTKQASRSFSRSRQHTVRRGESLSVIARRYGTTVTKIRGWNGLKSSRIYAGQRLRILT
jgi:membrane-bound lytic murein transglycosylase D